MLLGVHKAEFCAQFHSFFEMPTESQHTLVKGCKGSCYLLPKLESLPFQWLFAHVQHISN